jgi:hypothetical protein
MNDEKNNKYDLEERTYQFAKACEYVKGIKKTSCPLLIGILDEYKVYD